MSEVNFSSFEMDIPQKPVTIDFRGQQIEVTQYLPAEEKNSLLEMVIQKADVATILNSFALDVFFHLYIVMEYTNIHFNDEELEDLFALYDKMEQNGLIDAVVKAIPAEEYQTLRDYLLEMVTDYKTYRNSMKAILDQLSLFAPQTAADLTDKIKDLDVDKLEKILNIASETNENADQPILEVLANTTE